MNLSIAIPDSLLVDEATKIDKTKKISIIARTCAIFRVQEIFIYREGNGHRNDSTLISTLLKYLETPQFFRKKLFPKMDALKYAGVMTPLKIPSHLVPSELKMVKVGDVREGLVIHYKGAKFLDIGVNHLIPYFGKAKYNVRVIVQIKTINPKLTVKEIIKKEIKKYLGYKVKERASLISILNEWNGKTILTSRKGKIPTNTEIKQYVNTEKQVLVVFGSPEKGVHQILGYNIKKVQNSHVLNFFPNQATETVRFEEALLGTLSILNFIESNNT
tara:strand:+ start:1383 stop:2204 length:822 start_codon:yes stop_codon:yes gene_type:complete